MQNNKKVKAQDADGLIKFNYHVIIEGEHTLLVVDAQTSELAVEMINLQFPNNEGMYILDVIGSLVQHNDKTFRKQLLSKYN